MAKRAGNDLAEYFQSIASLCEETALNRKTVIRSLKALCESGFISDTGKRVGDTKQVVVYQIIGIFEMINNSKSDDLNSTKNGTIPESEQFQLFPETAPNLPANSTVFSTKESQIYAETVPNLGHGINTGINTGTKSDMRKSAEAPNAFSIFYDAYPKKKGRKNAEKAWGKLNPDDELIAKIMSALDQDKKSRGWLKDGGEYIPHPATWLNGRRWEDETDPPPSEPDARESTPSGFLGLAGLI